MLIRFLSIRQPAGEGEAEHNRYYKAVEYLVILPVEGCLPQYTTTKTVLLASRKEKHASPLVKSTYFWMK